MVNFYGDVSGDGTIGTKGLTLLTSHINGQRTLTGDDFLSADINNDGIINEKDLNALGETLVKTESSSAYYDPNEISGQFKIKATGYEPFSGHFSLNEIIKNHDGSFTTLTTSIEEGHGFSTLTVDFTYDTTVNYKSNDGVFLANKDYEVLSWGGIPLSRNWSVFNTTISSTGLFENFDGDIYTSVTDKPSILKHTNFVNIFKGSSVTDYGNFDTWDKSGVTLVRISGNLMANGFQVAGKMRVVNTDSDDPIFTFESGHKGTYELDINPNSLTSTFSIELYDSVDVAIAKRNELIQKSEINKNLIYTGYSKNVVPSNSITTVYK